MNRRTVLAGAGITLFSPLAGCSQDAESTSASSEPDYDATVQVSNKHTEQHTVGITITHDGPEGVIFEETHSIDPDEEIDVYDFTDAPTNGVETYTISGQLEAGGRDSIQYRTTRCYGNPGVYVSHEGKIRGTYSMC